MSRIVKVGTYEFHVEVHPLSDRGFTFLIVEIDLSGPNRAEARYDSHLRFETEAEAYDGGSADVRRRARKGSR